jgi:hypothetical protein
MLLLKSVNVYMGNVKSLYTWNVIWSLMETGMRCTPFSYCVLLHDVHERNTYKAHLTRGRVCLLYMMLAFASVVYLGSESLGSRDHILLSQIWDFSFRRLLRLAGSRWRYSTPPPHGYLTASQSQSYIATDGQSISKSWCRAPSVAHDHILITRWQLWSCFSGAPSRQKGRVCLLYMLLALASVVFLVSESFETRDHILLSQIWDFLFIASYDSQGHGGGIRTRLHNGIICMLSQPSFLILISVSDWVDPRTTMRLEELGELINPMTSWGIEPATFRLVA